MLTVRILSRLTPAPWTLRLGATLATATGVNSHPLNSKMRALKSFDEFCLFYEQHRQEVSAELLASFTRNLVSLINTRNDRITHDTTSAFISHLQKLELSDLSPKGVVGLLGVVRSLKAKGYSTGPLHALKYQLASRYLELVREKGVGELELGELISAYFELAALRLPSESRLVANKLMAAIQETATGGRGTLQNTQIFFLLHCLSLRVDLSVAEVRMREVLLRRVVEQLSSIRLVELVRVGVSLNRMDFSDLGGEEFSQVRLITQRIAEGVPDLDEEALFEIIRGEFNSNFNGFFRIYEEIRSNIFAEISPDGNAKVDSEAILRMLTHLADKIPLHRGTPDEQKFFAFLERYAEDCSDGDTAKNCGYRVHDLVAAGYFSGEQRQRVVEVVIKHGVTVNTNLLYEFASRGYPLAPLANLLAGYTVATLKEDILLKVGLVAHRMAAQNIGVAAAVLEEVNQRIAGLMGTPEQFMELGRRLGRSSIKHSEFKEVFGNLVERLPNPLVSAEGLPASYRSAYFSYMLDSCKTKDFLGFHQKHEAAITLDDFSLLLHHFFQREDARSERTELSRPLVHLAARRVQAVLEGRHRRGIEMLIEMVHRYCRLVVNESMDSHSEASLFRVLHTLISGLDALVETNTTNHFLNAIDIYLTRNLKRYNIEAPYRSLLRHLLSKLGQIATLRPRTASTIISAAIRLNCLTEQALEKVKVEEMKGLNFFERCRASYIKDKAFTPKLERLSPSTISLVLSNHNLSSYLVENERKIVEMLQTSSPKELVSYLIVSQQSRSMASRRVLVAVLDNLLARMSGLDRLDFSGVFHNALQSNIFQFSQFKKLAERVAQEYRERIGLYSIETHLELLKFIISQPALNPREYYNELIDFAKRRDDVHSAQLQHILLALASTNYFFREQDLALLPAIARNNLNSAVFFFLMLENHILPAQRNAFLKDFSEKYAQTGLTLSSHFYMYLKKKYPEETAALTLSEQRLRVDRISTKPKDTELVKIIVELGGGSSEELTEFGAGNYLLKIKHVVLIFLNSKRMGSYHEHEFLKRAVSVIRGEELKTVCLHVNSTPSALEYLHKSVPNLFVEEELLKTTAQLKEEQQKGREKRKAEATAAKTS